MPTTIPVRRRECPQCGEARWHEHRDGQCECLDCGLIAFDERVAANYVDGSKWITNGRQGRRKQS